MNRAELEQLIHRSLDGGLTAEESLRLSRALAADPLLRAEVEEAKAVHGALAGMFRQLALPGDFSARLMRRIQPPSVPVLRPARRMGRMQALRRARSRGRGAWLIATMSAAAALVLAVALIVQMEQNQLGGAGRESGQISWHAGGQGVPDVSGDHRTDPLTPHVSGQGTPAPEPESGVPVAPTADDQGSPTESPEPVAPSVGETPTPPDSPEPAPPAATPPETPGTQPEPQQPGVDRATVAGPPVPTPQAIGRAGIVAGALEMLSPEGRWNRVAADAELRAGAQLRTTVNGTAHVTFAAGTVTLARRSAVTLTGAGSVSLDSGSVAIDREQDSAGAAVSVACDGYTVYVVHGAAVVERKRRGLSVQHVMGLSTITHDDYGSVVLEANSQLEVESGKDYPDAKPIAANLPDWSARSRAAALFAQLEPRVVVRGFTAAQRRILDRNLPRALDQLMAYPVDRGAAYEFIARALENTKLDAQCVCDMVAELETTILELKDSVPDHLAWHGARAAGQSDTVSFATWRESFLRLARGDNGRALPAVNPRRHRHPGDTRLRRADEPRKPNSDSQDSRN